MAGGAGGNDFYDPVGRSRTSPVSQLIRIADYAYVRFDYGFVVVCEPAHPPTDYNSPLPYRSLTVPMP